MTNPILIAGDQPLADFRGGLTGEFALQLLNQGNGRLLVTLPVGVGKTAWLLAIISYVLAAQRYDLVVVLVPTWDILRELRARLPEWATPTVLSPRPQRRCGSLDAEWLRYERQGCGLLGKDLLCDRCPHRRRCRWPEQYGEALQGARTSILATQQHLAVNPNFLGHIQEHAGASRQLALIDESNLLLRPVERLISHAAMERFIEAQGRAIAETEGGNSNGHRWLQTSRIFLAAPTVDLRNGRWRFPPVYPEWATEVQRTGWDQWGDGFRFLGY